MLPLGEIGPALTAACARSSLDDDDAARGSWGRRQLPVRMDLSSVRGRGFEKCLATAREAEQALSAAVDAIVST